MKVHIVQIRSGGIDGWGQTIPATVTTIGVYDSREKAVAARDARAANKDLSCFDIGKAWIEEKEIE